MCVIWGYIVFLGSLETVDLCIHRLEMNSWGMNDITVCFANLMGVVYVKGFCKNDVKWWDQFFFHLVRVTGVSKTKFVPHLCLTCCFAHLVTGSPEENGGDNPAWGTKPVWPGLAGGTVSCRREMSLWGRIARPCALLTPAVSLSTPALPGH